MNTVRQPSGGQGDRFVLLDLLRGIAAISVLVYHSSNFLGVHLLPNGYLAVDLFFLLSGFVIAHNYDPKIASGMSLTDFMAQRLIRLYPCLLLTLVLGLVVYAARMVQHEGYLDSWRIATAFVLNALFLPGLVQPYGNAGYYPFDGAAWSLTFELFANVVYWLTFRYLDLRRVVLLILVAAAASALGVYLAGGNNIDFGMLPTNFWWGIPRVLLTFFTGVALRRYVYARIPLNLGGGAAWLTLLVLLLTFSLTQLLGNAANPLTDLFSVLVIFPALVLVVGRATPGPRTALVCKWAGDASYPLYLLQTPFMGVVAAVPQLLWQAKAAEFVPWIGLIFIGATIVLALLIDRYFELPLRARLRTWWRDARARKRPVAWSRQP